MREWALCFLKKGRGERLSRKIKIRLKARIDIVNDKILRNTETFLAIGNLTVTDRWLVKPPPSTPATPPPRPLFREIS